MPLEDTVQRTGAKKDRDQELKVVSTNNTAVTLKFVNNAFRKHVLLKSRKGTAADDKSAHIAEKRRAAKRKDDYGAYTKYNTMIDTHAAELNIIMLEMAAACLALNMTTGQKLDNTRFTFTKPYVRQVNMIRDANSKWVADHVPALGTTITFDVEMKAPNLFEIGHCTGP